jgi:hypothetical protein
LTGIALTNLALFAALLGIYELGRTWLDEKAARRAAIYAALIPPGFAFSMLYPEALALALLVWGAFWR